ncbi:ATP-binding protein [Myxococcus sp. AS-1-15]|uniref:ATP-binding protein n=1 Tax=Myxococcus sp. AS-1-15 TaxID=2874600 RepID=UPI001CBCDF08|nr:ATP-binding protein [Myxococcus sp. AS-1-15]MBZ4402012.1 ATP-binding protein [Myxococcus sp. AS-1-15]
MRLALIGPSGSGKTYTALRIARGLVGPTGRIAVGDTENESASKYADRFEFDTQPMTRFSPRDFIALIADAAREKYDCLIIDSLSHAWMGRGGALEMVDQVAKQSKSKNSFDAWRSVTPEHNAMVDALIRAPMHLIVTMRVKTEYVVEEVNGKKTPRKIGLAPVQRDGLEYEFDVVADMDGAELVVTKTRCPTLQKAVIIEPGEPLGETLGAWLTDGAATETATTTATQVPSESRSGEGSPVARPARPSEQAQPASEPAQAARNGLHGPDTPAPDEDEWKAEGICTEADIVTTEAEVRSLSEVAKTLKRDDLRKKCGEKLKATCRRLGIVPPPKPAQSAQQREPGQD